MPNVTLPFILQNGQLADANQVMADFYVLRDWINNNAAAANITPGRIVAGGGTIAGVAATDGTVVIVNATTNPTIYQLPPTPLDGQTVTVKDGSDATHGAALYNISIVTTDGATIDITAGATGVKIITQNGALRFEYRTANWSVV